MHKLIMSSLAALVLALPMTACDNPNDGPAENAGEKIDEGINKTGEAIEDTADKVGDKLEEAGDAIQEKTDQ